MKTSTFNNVKFEMSQKGYGQYTISATYKGQHISVHSTESEVWDWLDDDSNKEKYQYARRYCYNQIRNAYENR